MNKTIICNLIISMLFCCALTTNAQPVSQSQAKEKAMNFFKNAASDDANVKSRKGIRKAPQVKLVNDRDEYFIFNDDANGGYVIIAGEERMPDVLGYSYNGHIESDKIPCNMQMLLDGYASQVRYLQEHPEAPAVKVSAGNRQPINPLLKTEWGQTEPYYNMCPLYNGKRCVTGCEATAMAQIMYYHKWPNSTLETIPEYTTETNGITVPSISLTTIDWNNMLQNYDGSYTKKQGDAVALLMKLCGASAEMDYTPTESGCSSYKFVNAFSKYFEYGGLEIHYRENFSDDIWTQMMYDELKEGRPLYYVAHYDNSWDGHAFVLDGYDNRGYFHINMGWSGSNDGYYLLSSIREYIDNHLAIIGIRPNKGNTPIPYAVLNNGTLTFYYDKLQSKRQGTVFSIGIDYDAWPRQWFSRSSEIIKVVADPSFAVYKLYDLSYMFYGCDNVETIDIRYFDTSNVADMSSMFDGCSHLKTIICNDSWAATNSADMFDRCYELVGGNGFTYNSDCTTVEYANPGKRGYFTTLNDSEWLLGDVNLDKTVDISDVVAIINTIAGITSFEHSDVNNDGNTDISDIVKVINIIAGTDQKTNDKNDPAVEAGLCPDSNHPHIIDMGNVGLWACCNVGASAPWEYGGYYAWGEIEEKDYYDWSTYKHCDGSEYTCHDLGSDIAGTKWDVAHLHKDWGGKWQMPNHDQQILLLNCTNEWTSVNGINGRKFTAPNGGTIFLPAAGRRGIGDTGTVGSYGRYWSSTQYPKNSDNADDLGFGISSISWDDSYRYEGKSVRPIYSESQQENPNVNPSDDRFCLLSYEVDGVTYSLYTKNDKSDKHTNADGWEFYKSEFILDVTKNGKTESYVISNDLYLCDSDGQRQCMAIDLNSNTIHVFTNSKCDDRTYMMDGYYFVSPLDNISFKSERVFGSQNWGWMPYFTYTEGRLELQHFSFAGYYAMTSSRNTDGSWNNSRGGSIQPGAFEERLNEHGSVLVIEKESDPAVVAGLCPDSHHPHVIDMGAAGKWACCNVGASSPWEYGGYYAWGETEEKSTYDWSTYAHCDGSSSTCHKLGSDIAGTNYDVAHEKWGGKWRMPNYDQQMLLNDNCSSEWTSLNGINGRKFTAPNGGTVFLPAAGYCNNDRKSYAGRAGYYWSSTQHTYYSYNAFYLNFDSTHTIWNQYNRCNGQSVRPIYE